MLAKCKIVFLFFLVSSFNCKEKKEIVKHETVVEIAKNDEIKAQKKVLPGAYRTEAYLDIIKNKNVAFLVNQTSLIGEIHLVDSLFNLGVAIKKIFAPAYCHFGGELHRFWAAVSTGISG